MPQPRPSLQIQRTNIMPTQPQIVSIADPATGSEAKILVSLGFNCFSWRPVLDDGPREMLVAAPGFRQRQRAALGQRHSAVVSVSGTHWRGEVFSSPGGSTSSNRATPLATRFTASFTSGRGASWSSRRRASSASSRRRSTIRRSSSCWPSDFRIRVSYEVRGRELLSDIRLREHRRRRPCPAASARTPISACRSPRSRPEDTLVYAPVSKIWELHDMLATGQDTAARRRMDLDGGPLAGRPFDTSYTGFAAEADGLVPHLAPRAEERPHRDPTLRPVVHAVHRLHAAASRSDLPGAVHLPARFLPIDGRRA